ncbi:FecR family protein [Deltaproteobacteria bacterium TL4]
MCDTKWTRLGLLCGLVIFLIGPMPANAVETAIATLAHVVGKVEVTISRSNKRTLGRNGLLLYANDQITTGVAGKVTVLFRDGSEIRLFENTQFTIESGEEIPTRKRTFQYKLFMKLGSFWGKFIKERQETSIRTPTATIGIKGTTLRISEAEDKASVALAEGKISVKNATSEVELIPGKRIKEFSKTDQLAEKIEDIPYKLFINSETYQLDFKEGDSKKFRLDIQIGEVANKKNLKRAGAIYLKSNYNGVRFPSDVKLDADGFTRVPIEIDPPRKDDDEFDGSILIWAVMDDTQSDDVGEGTLLIKTKSQQAKQNIRFDANSGDMIPTK